MTLKVSTNNSSKLQKIKKTHTNAPHTHTHTNTMIHTFEDTHKTQKEQNTTIFLFADFSVIFCLVIF